MMNKGLCSSAGCLQHMQDASRSADCKVHVANIPYTAFLIMQKLVQWDAIIMLHAENKDSGIIMQKQGAVGCCSCSDNSVTNLCVPGFFSNGIGFTLQ